MTVQLVYEEVSNHGLIAVTTKLKLFDQHRFKKTVFQDVKATQHIKGGPKLTQYMKDPMKNLQ